MGKLLAFPHQCELVEVYYGHRCTVPGCETFYPFGCAPWDAYEGDYFEEQQEEEFNEE